METEIDTKLDVKQALRVFDKITTYGQKVEDEYRLGDISASTSFDGYTVSLRDDQVDIDVMFHQTQRVNFKSRPAYENFLKKMKAIDKRDFSDSTPRK